MTHNAEKVAGVAHDCRDNCTGSDPSLDRWSERTRHWYCLNGNDNCAAHGPAAADDGLDWSTVEWYYDHHGSLDEFCDWLEGQINDRAAKAWTQGNQAGLTLAQDAQPWWRRVLAPRVTPPGVDQ